MKIAVLTSGGVDSSVALKLLHDQGHDLTAFYLKIWLEDELSHLGDCPWEEDLKYVKAICQTWHIPLQIISLQKEYQDVIVKYTLDEIKAGRTPNPDILCNKHIKFGLFYDTINILKKDDEIIPPPQARPALSNLEGRGLGGGEGFFDKIATGHYAQIEEKNSSHQAEASEDKLFYLKKSADPVKDQTYFLSHLTQAQLSRALFPIGHLLKKEVRALAKKFDLPNQNRKDSQGLCFLGKIKFNEFIKHHVGEKPGDIIEKETNKKLGTHQGFWYHTIGQRQGLKLGNGPWFVVDKDTKNNIIYISHQKNLASHAKNTFNVTNINWIPNREFVETQNFPSLQVKIRHGEKSYNCDVRRDEPSARLHVTLAAPDPGLSPGQFAVFYDKEYCLGGGTIE